MRHLGLSPLLACSLALSVGLPVHAHAFDGTIAVQDVEQAAPARKGRVFIDATALGEAGPYLAGESTKRASECLVAEGVASTDAPAGPELRVTIAPGETTGYSITYVIVYDGEELEGSAGASDCQLCTEGELLDRVDAIAKEQAPKMVEPVEEPDIEPEDGGGVQIVPPGGEGEDTTPEGMGGMGKAGVALLVAGGAATVTGVVLVALPPKHFPIGDPDANMIETTRPPGYAVLGGGVALAVTGAVLLALDVRRRKRATDDGAAAEAEPKASARVAPWFGGRGAGLGITGRF